MSVRGQWHIDINPDDRINELRESLQKRILKKAVGRGSKLVVNELKQLLPSKTNALRTSIGSKMIGKKPSHVCAVVGAKNKYQRTVNGKVIRPAKYLHLVEWGHKSFNQLPTLAKALLVAGAFPRASANIGRASGVLYMEQAFNTTKFQYMKVAEASVREDVEKELFKRNTRAGTKILKGILGL
jgi:hypothetical protein